MKGLGTLFGRDNDSQAIRQSAALTTVYLLELNRKFEGFMRERVEELEGRVSAQQARRSAKAPVEAAWADEFPVEAEEIENEMQFEDVEPLAPAAGFDEADEMKMADNDQTIVSEPATEPVEAEIPDYTALLIGDPVDTPASAVSSERAADEPSGADETVPETELDAIAPGNPVPTESQTSAPIPEETPERSRAGLDLLTDAAALSPTAETAPGQDPEPIEPAGASDPSGIEDEVASLPEAEKLILLTGDRPPAEEGLPASTLLTVGAEEMIGWSAEDQQGEVIRSDAEAALIEEATLDTPAESSDPDDEGGEWDATLPAAGQKGEWA